MMWTRKMLRLFVDIVILLSLVSTLGGCIQEERQTAVAPTQVFEVMSTPVSTPTPVSPPPVADSPPQVTIPVGVGVYPAHVREWMRGEEVWAEVKAYWELWAREGLSDVEMTEGALLAPVFGEEEEPIYPAVVIDERIWLPPLDLEASVQKGELVFREPPRPEEVDIDDLLNNPNNRYRPLVLTIEGGLSVVDERYRESSQKYFEVREGTIHLVGDYDFSLAVVDPRTGQWREAGEWALDPERNGWRIKEESELAGGLEIALAIGEGVMNNLEKLGGCLVDVEVLTPETMIDRTIELVEQYRDNLGYLYPGI